MSLRYEQYRSLQYTRKFLYDYLQKETRPKNITETKAHIVCCLRHFPPLHNNGQPIFSKDDLTEDYKS